MILSRRALLQLGIGGALARPARAQGTRSYRILMLLWRGETPVEKGFRDYLAEQDMRAEFLIRDLDRDLSRLPGFIAEARNLKPDLVYTWGTGITLGTVGPWDAPDARVHLTDVPVVFSMVSSPWKTGIAAPPDRPPRAFVTGAVHIAPLEVQINAIRAYLPLRKLGIVYNRQEPNSVSNAEDLRALGGAMNFELLEAPLPTEGGAAPSPDAIPGAVADLARRGAQVLYIGPDNFVGAHRAALTAAGLAEGLPCFTGTELEIRDGDAMFGLVSRYDMVGRLAASKAMRILAEGRSPGEVPIETLQRFSYVVRLPVAFALKLYPPLPLLDYAEVIR